MDEPPELIVRLAAASDLDAVAALWHESASSMDSSPREVPSTQAMRERISAELASGWELHVAMFGNCVVGMLALKPGEAWLDQIFVTPEEQGKGVGRALLSAAKRAMPQGFQLRMAASNLRAARFYEKEGLERLRDGVHPWTGAPVIFYGWSLR